MNKYDRLYLQGITKLETKYVPAVFRVIKAFRKRFIDDLKKNGADYATNRMQLAFINPELSDIVQKIYRDAGLMGARLSARELKELANQKTGGFGTNESWIQSIIDFLQIHHLRLVNGITDTMRNDILRVLERQAENGWSIDVTVGELQKTELMLARAKVIARTEIVRAANVGHSVAAKETEYEVDKEWSAARDHRTRHSHKEANGHVVDENGTFKVAIYDGDNIVGYDNMQYPGDATAHVSNTANCRCRAKYKPKRDANGRLIMRKPGNTATIIPMQRQQEYTPAQIAAQLKASVQIIVE